MVEFLDLQEELNENTRIIIYPCINLVLMREDIEGLLRSFEEEDDSENGVKEVLAQNGAEKETAEISSAETDSTAADSAEMKEIQKEADYGTAEAGV